MDKILYNAKIYSPNNQESFYEAVGIKDNLIVKVGNNQEVLSLRNTSTILIDCEGKLVIPGFNDSHMHLLSTGRLLSWVNLSNAKSISDVINITKEFILNNEQHDVIVGHGWNHDYFRDDKRFITASDLDQVSTTKPILLYRACGHIMSVNSQAIKIANIDLNHQVNGGEFDLKNGVFKENAIDLITKIIPEPTVEDIKTDLIKAMKHCNAYGITSVQSDDFSPIERINYKNTLIAYNELVKENKMSLRVYEQSLLPSLSILNKFIKDGYYTGMGNDLFKIGPVKLLADGSMGARTAALLNPYHDDNSTKGILNYSNDDLLELIKLAHNNNLQIAVHGIGDAAITQIVDSFEIALKNNPRIDHRHGIVHAQITNLELIKRMKNLKLLVYAQPIFIHYDKFIVEKRVGKEIASTSYLFKTMKNQGVEVSFGTDSPIEKVNPLDNIYTAVTRLSLNPEDKVSYLENEKFLVKEAINHYTIRSSYASFDEDKKGLIKEGYLADLVVLDNDIIENNPIDILKTTVLMTIMDGNIVYKA